jgi:hypothetical protein
MSVSNRIYLWGNTQEGFCVVYLDNDGTPYHALPDETIYPTEREARAAAAEYLKRQEVHGQTTEDQRILA